MSNATESDYSSYLAQQLEELIVEAGKSQDGIIADFARRGILQSSAGIIAGVSALDHVLSSYISNLSESLEQWTGDRLSIETAREMLVRHLRDAIGKTVHRELAYRIFASGEYGGLDGGFDLMLEDLRKKLLSRVRTIEIGVMAKPPVQSITNNNVSAGTIQGPIL